MPENNPFKRTNDPIYVDGPPQKSSKKGWLIGCGIAGLIVLLVCCGGVAFFGIKGPAFIADAVNAAMAEQLQGQLADDPSVQQQIGEIQSLEFDFTKTIESAKKASEAGEEPRLAFRIQGSAGSGMVYIVQDKSAPNGVGISSGTLVMDDGTEYPLDANAVNEAAKGGLQINIDDMIDDGNAEPQDPGIIDIGPIDLESAGQNGSGIDNLDR